ncbi:MAG: hypothetical protein HOW97_03030 [Catenulispora sp.]|nr:hypothetical protein [Catenulispora sp.]
MVEWKWPEWMTACTTCQTLIAALTQATAPFPHAAVEAVREHLIDAHLAAVPGYVDDCGNCQEWKALAANPDRLKPRIVPVLGREDLLHRAGHLFVPSAPSA